MNWRNISRYVIEGEDEFRKTFPEIDAVDVNVDAKVRELSLRIVAVDGRESTVVFKRNPMDY